MNKIKLLLCLSLIFIIPNIAMADSDNNPLWDNTGPNIIQEYSDREIHVYRNFYVPYMPNSTECHGAYRLITHTANYDVCKIVGKLNYTINQTASIDTSRGVSDVFQTVDMVRSDLVIFTNFGVVDEEITYRGNYVYHDTYYYETPSLVVGYFIDLSPVLGSVVLTDQQRPYFVAFNMKDLNKIIKGPSPEKILQGIINHPVSTKINRLISKGNGKDYIVYWETNGNNRVVLNWWKELSQEFIKNLETDDIFLEDVSDIYDEMSYRNGKILNPAPVYSGRFDKKSPFLTMDAMRNLWDRTAEEKKNEKNPFPKHFTDTMAARSPGNWIDDQRLVISYDPNLLARWPYQKDREPIKENLPISVSTRVPNDFSVLKSVSRELYSYVAPAGDPNLFFAFAPFDDWPFDYSKSVCVMFPETKRYSETQPVDLGLKDTFEDLNGNSEQERAVKEALKAWKPGSGKFEGDMDAYNYDVTGCYFIPGEKDKALAMLMSNGFGNILNKLGESAPKNKTKLSGRVLKEWF